MKIVSFNNYKRAHDGQEFITESVGKGRPFAGVLYNQVDGVLATFDTEGDLPAICAQIQAYASTLQGGTLVVELLVTRRGEI